MVKLALLILAFVALIHSSVQIKCYNCKEKNIMSTVPEAANLTLCDNNDISKSQQLHSVELNCKKILEKVKEGGKETTNVLRFPGPENMKDININVLKEYTCNTDLCNEAVSFKMSVILVLLLSLAAVFIAF